MTSRFNYETNNNYFLSKSSSQSQGQSQIHLTNTQTQVQLEIKKIYTKVFEDFKNKLNVKSESESESKSESISNLTVLLETINEEVELEPESNNEEHFVDEHIPLPIEELLEEDQWEYPVSETSESSLSDSEIIHNIYKSSNLVEIIIQDKII